MSSSSIRPNPPFNPELFPGIGVRNLQPGKPTKAQEVSQNERSRSGFNSSRTESSQYRCQSACPASSQLTAAALAKGYHAAGDGGGGHFYWDMAATDPDNGGTVIQRTGVATGRWKRIYSGAVHAKWFGAKLDGVSNDSGAFRALSSFIESQDGGSIVVEAGTAVIGEQTFAGDQGLGFAYRAEHIIWIENCTKPVVIHFQGTRLLFASGLKFGAFDRFGDGIHNKTAALEPRLRS